MEIDSHAAVSGTSPGILVGMDVVAGQVHRFSQQRQSVVSPSATAIIHVQTPSPTPCVLVT
jgi:hypothetical protein